MHGPEVKRGFIFRSGWWVQRQSELKSEECRVKSEKLKAESKEQGAVRQKEQT